MSVALAGSSTSISLLNTLPSPLRAPCSMTMKRPLPRLTMSPSLALPVRSLSYWLPSIG
ncbi:hypothetical protein D3C72_2462950 [compost metagenome]